MCYIGLDLGTSSLKGLLVDRNGNILREESAEYSVFYPSNGWSEQNPSDWIIAMKKILAKLTKDIEQEIKGISFGGQMHGLVILDKDDNIIRPCILWNDGRTQKQTDYLNEVVGKENLSKYTANIAFAGFTAPKIMWLKENEPQNFAKISKIMLPKDYLAYVLTGVHSTDYSDASGTLFLDVQNKCWSKKMCELCGVDEEWLPKLYESFEVTGKIKAEYNLPNAIVTAGAGDNAAAAIGTGAIGEGGCNISLGTSGTIFISSEKFSVDKHNALHSFCHADGRFHLMGCILSAASCNEWWMKVLGAKDYPKEQENLLEKLGKNHVFFLPYLMGERSPHNDVNARGVLLGMTPETTRGDMTLAVMEGVAFALRDCLEIAKANGVSVTSSTICGGGAKSKLWIEIIANVLGIELKTLQTEQGPSYGGAILAMVGAGEYNSLNEAKQNLVKIKSCYKPSENLHKNYNDKYRVFKKLYESLKDVFGTM